MEVGILTVSDSCSQGTSQDKSGPVLKEIIEANGWRVVEMKTVPDEIQDIRDCLLDWSDNRELNLILTTGGTGFAQRDVTPEATEAVLDKKAPGLVHRIISQSLQVTPMAMLSRLSAGSRGQSLIINFPGSPKACKECLGFVLPALGHASDLLRGHDPKVKAVHQVMQAGSCGGHSCSKNSVQVTSGGGVAGRARISPYPMISVEEAQRIVLSFCSTLEVVERDFMDPHAHVLAEDVDAKDALPPFRASIKDGYAVLASDGKGRRPVQGGIIAGSKEKASLRPGYCARINTGAPIPDGADAVVQVEDTLLAQATEDGQEELMIEILSEPQAGQDIRPIGSDIQSGLRVLEKFSTLSAPERGLLATVGVTKIKTFRSPIVSLLSTGNELQEPGDGQPLRSGAIRDSNKSTLKALLAEHNFGHFDAGIAVDEPQVLEDKLREAFRQGDIIVSTGGVSMGDRDILREVLQSAFQAQIHFARVNMKPGKPTTFATLNFAGQTKILLGLPGNPVSATVTSHLYLLPACRKMAGFVDPRPAVVRAKIRQNFPLDSRPEFHRAFIHWEKGQAVASAQPTGNQISSRLLSLHAANALLIFPGRTEDKPIIKCESEIDAMIIGPLMH
eukprot:maker-scaffold334_size202906-snap-gene-1.38 protein:Tk08973 transcript:maker-scaffold334_size202906-snap-gene-1.38-mRNA-1 annotation:"Gephyrin"